MNATLPFYPLNAPEPMYCICDHGGPKTGDWCAKCPYRSDHRAAAIAELEAREAAAGVKENSK